MQNKNELLKIITRDRPDVSLKQAEIWCHYLSQLDACELYSATSPQKDEEEWLQQRQAGIGGSEVAAIMGENDWSSPRQIWLSKMGMFSDKPPRKSEPALWGNLLETPVADEWARRTGRAYVHIPVILMDPEHPWRLANIDGFTLSEDLKYITGILEIKTTSAYNREAWEIGPIPYYYVCQVNWYCGITGLTNYTIACLVGGQHLFYYDLPALPTVYAAAAEAADTFWHENILKGVEPAATHADLEKVKEIQQDLTLPAKIISDEGDNRLIEVYCNVREKYRKLGKLKDGLYAQLFLMMGEHASAISTKYALNVKEQQRRSCIWDLLKQKYPAAYDECVHVSRSRSLEVK